MVTAAEAAKHFGIPRASFYWLVKKGYIHPQPGPAKSHYLRKRLLFKLSEVAEDLARLPKPPTE